MTVASMVGLGRSLRVCVPAVGNKPPSEPSARHGRPDHPRPSLMAHALKYGPRRKGRAGPTFFDIPAAAKPPCLGSVFSQGASDAFDLGCGLREAACRQSHSGFHAAVNQHRRPCGRPVPPA